MDVHKFIRDHYAKKFPELESLVPNALDYARVVQAIGNEMEMANINLSGILPSATIMVVSVTGSTTNGQPLEEEELALCLEACDELLKLDGDFACCASGCRVLPQCKNVRLLVADLVVLDAQMAGGRHSNS